MVFRGFFYFQTPILWEKVVCHSVLSLRQTMQVTALYLTFLQLVVAVSGSRYGHLVERLQTSMEMEIGILLVEACFVPLG